MLRMVPNKGHKKYWGYNKWPPIFVRRHNIFVCKDLIHLITGSSQAGNPLNGTLSVNTTNDFQFDRQSVIVSNFWNWFEGLNSISDSESTTFISDPWFGTPWKKGMQFFGALDSALGHCKKWCPTGFYGRLCKASQYFRFRFSVHILGTFCTLEFCRIDKRPHDSWSDQARTDNDRTVVTGQHFRTCKKMTRLKAPCDLLNSLRICMRNGRVCIKNRKFSIFLIAPVTHAITQLWQPGFNKELPFTPTPTHPLLGEFSILNFLKCRGILIDWCIYLVLYEVFTALQ